jgi:hypothetical protein
MTPPQHWSWQRQRQHLSQAIAKTPDDGIPRPATDIKTYPGKMLALPIPSIRPVDVNAKREAGYMGINPITLTGETGLLPGAWGEGKEFVNSMAWHRSNKRALQYQHRQPPLSASQKLLQQKYDEMMISVEKMSLQYAQAILNGDVFEESSVDVDSPHCSLITESLLSASLPPESGACDEDKRDWVDVSDDEKSVVDGKTEACHKREDSGYSSAEASYRKTLAQGKWPVAKWRKTVRFDEETVEKQGEETKAGKLRRAW